MEFGSYLRSVRKGIPMTQQELAERVGINNTYVSKLENGHDDTPSEELLIRFAIALEEDPHRMIVKAGKIPSDFIDVILHDETVFSYLKKKYNAKVSAKGG